MYLPPWHKLTQINCYYDNISDDEARLILQNRKIYSYIFTNYRGKSANLFVKVDPLNTEIVKTTLHFLPMPNSDPHKQALAERVFPYSTCLNRSSCDLPYTCLFPANRKSPRSLLELTRATISQNFTQQHIIDEHIPNTLRSYILTPHPSSDFCLVICDECLNLLLD